MLDGTLHQPVEIFSLPHNGRCALYPGEVDADGEALACPSTLFLDLPIRMPQAVHVITGPDDRVLALEVLGESGGRTRREDVATVWAGVCQYNADLAAPAGEGEGNDDAAGDNAA